jgi:glycosyltransferase involved in cell wall biosynthesis
LQIGPVPPPVEGGISAYLEGLLRSSLAQQFDLLTFDVKVPPLYRNHRALRPWLSGRFAAGLDRRLRRTAPDLVHIHTSDYAGFWEKAVLAALVQRRGIPCILHLHGGSFDVFLRDLSGLRARLAARTLASARRVITTAAAWRPLLERFLPANRLAVLPNAIHVRDFSAPRPPRSGPEIRLLFIGMLSERKGLDDLLHAWLELRGSPLPPLRLDVVGGDEVPGSRREFERRFRAAGFEPSVRFHGALGAAARWRCMESADVFVLPSRHESFGIANLEAMAAGLAVISTRTGAVPEYLDDGVHGLLVEPGDVAGLARAIARLALDPDLRAHLGQAARVRAAAFDWEAVGDRLARLYEDCLGERVRVPVTGASRRS